MFCIGQISHQQHKGWVPFEIVTHEMVVWTYDIFDNNLGIKKKNW